MSQKVQYYFDILRTRTRNGAEEKEREWIVFKNRFKI